MNSCTFRSATTSATGLRSIDASKDRRLRGWRCVAWYVTAAVVIWFATDRAQASTVQLQLSTSDPTQTSGTWTVTALLSDNQSLGTAAVSIDVLGSPGVTVLRAANGIQTLQVSNPPYSLFRSTGTLIVPNLTGITAAQDTITAANNNDPSILRFGDGLLSTASGQVYGVIPPSGPLTLATGRWTTSGFGTIRAVLTPGSFFNLFPLNYAVDDGNGTGSPPPPGTVQNTPFAANVLSSQTIHIGALDMPEPASVVLFLFGSAGLLAISRRGHYGVTGSWFRRRRQSS